MQQSFDTPHPTDLLVEVGAGDIQLEAVDADTTEVEVTGQGAGDTTVEQRGRRIVVTGPRGGLFGRSHSVHVQVRLPLGSTVETRLGSADLVATGTLGEVTLRSGSGSVRLECVEGDAVVKSGSGQLTVAAVTGDLRISTGSGDLELGTLGGRADATSGSGRVRIGTVAGELTVKTGSGDLQVQESGAGATLRTGSGAVVVGRVHGGQLLAKSGSGDVRVGVPAGVPVWTDISTGSGELRSDLQGTGEPREGQDFVELRVRTGSGSVRLEQV